MSAKERDVKLWKALGFAGVAGVAASGAIIARDRRQRANLTPDEVRGRLRERLADAEDRSAAGAGEAPAG